MKASDRVRLMATLIHDIEDVYEIWFNLPGNANSLNLCILLCMLNRDSGESKVFSARFEYESCANHVNQITIIGHLKTTHLQCKTCLRLKVIDICLLHTHPIKVR